MQDGAEGERDFDARAGSLWPYLQGRGVEICPALNRAAADFKTKARGAAFGYGYNLLVGTRGNDGVKISQARSADRLAIFADCAQVNDFLAPASPDHPMLEEFYYFETNITSLTIHFRHRQRTQVWYADGHVSSVIPFLGSIDTRLPTETVGRLDPDLVTPF
ncbi:MAG TPA: hypothetical protein VMF06_12915 [Candidatus Limnocylindria bacterium]|nr:hypothetical protein [Candidatus Limnocylindria bacterium]